MPNIHIRASRGQDISEFLPHPDVILMADLIYYEEVSVCMSIRVPFVILRLISQYNIWNIIVELEE